MTLRNKLIKTMQTGLLAGTLMSPMVNTAVANDIVIGTRGPTDWQADFRAGYSEKTDDKKTTTKVTTQNDVLKYWNTMIKQEGNKGEFGVWAFANIPSYKSVEVENAKGKTSRAEGFGDFVFGAGPRGSFNVGDGSFHFLSYGGAILPTGDMEKGKPSLTGDRVDAIAGGFFTYFPDKNKKLEVDLAGQYNFAGKNGLGVQGPDSFSGGLIAGGRVFDNDKLEIRLAGGINGQYRQNLKEGGWDNSYGPRVVARFTPKFKDGIKHGHLEITGDYDTSAKNMPKGFGVFTQLRVNYRNKNIEQRNMRNHNYGGKAHSTLIRTTQHR